MSAQQNIFVWTGHGSTFFNQLASMHSGQQFCDIIVSCDNHEYHIHKLVLLAFSDLFREMVQSDPGIFMSTHLELTHINPCDFEILINFMYTGRCNMDVEKLPKVLEIAQFLKVQSLADFIMNEIANMVKNSERQMSKRSSGNTKNFSAQRKKSDVSQSVLDKTFPRCRNGQRNQSKNSNVLPYEKDYKDKQNVSYSSEKLRHSSINTSVHPDYRLNSPDCNDRLNASQESDVDVETVDPPLIDIADTSDTDKQGPSHEKNETVVSSSARSSICDNHLQIQPDSTASNTCMVSNQGVNDSQGYQFTTFNERNLLNRYPDISKSTSELEPLNLSNGRPIRQTLPQLTGGESVCTPVNVASVNTHIDHASHLESSKQFVSETNATNGQTISECFYCNQTFIDFHQLYEHVLQMHLREK